MIAVTARDLPEIHARMTDWAREPTLDGAACPHRTRPLLGGERVNVLRR